MLIVGGGEELCVEQHLALSFPPDYTAQGWSRPKKQRCSLPGRTALGTATGGIALHSCKLFLFHLTSPADGLGLTAPIPQPTLQLKPPKIHFSNIQPLNVEQNLTKSTGLERLVWAKYTSPSILQKPNLFTAKYQWFESWSLCLVTAGL